ncbi:MAG: hypothetical protein ACK5TG_07985 [Planctomyces sp.]|jgi:PIN domain nuclease of toxin-antitoxin system
MKLLMDTHAFLWLVEGHNRLSSARLEYSINTFCHQHGIPERS